MNDVHCNDLELKLLNYEDFCIVSRAKSKDFLVLLRNIFNEFQKNARNPFGPLTEILIEDLDLEVILFCSQITKYFYNLFIFNYFSNRLSGKNFRHGIGLSFDTLKKNYLEL